MNAPDERQRTFRRIIGNLVGAMQQSDGQIAVNGSVTGFRASAVDLGHLQTLANDALGLLTMEQVRERWNEDVMEWLLDLLRLWVQRRKQIRFDLAENGIHIELETQDDHGYYRYEFDVFPGKRR